MTATTLPELTGSAKQIAWASDIRARMLDAVERELDGIMGRVKDTAAAARQCQQIREWLSSQADASWWIERDAMSVQPVMREAVQALTAAR